MPVQLLMPEVLMRCACPVTSGRSYTLGGGKFSGPIQPETARFWVLYSERANVVCALKGEGTCLLFLGLGARCAAALGKMCCSGQMWTDQEEGRPAEGLANRSVALHERGRSCHQNECKACGASLACTGRVAGVVWLRKGGAPAPLL